MNIDRVLLLYPPDSSNTFSISTIARMEPLALEYIAACFKTSEVVIVDLRVEPNLKKYLKEFKPSLVGITGYTCHVNVMLGMAAEIKKFDSGIKVIVGGVHASLRPHDFDTPEIDFVIIGEGTSVVSEWLLNEGDSHGIDGLAYRRNGRLVYNQPRVYPELGTLPSPSRNLVDRYRKKYVFEGSSDFAVVRTSLGCPFRCNFCCLWGLTGGRYLKRPIDQIIAEIENIQQKMIFFADDESMIDSIRMAELAKGIKMKGIKKKYYMYARADTVVKNPKLFGEWKDLGLDTVLIGYEAFSDVVLANFNKGTSVEIQNKATAILSVLGIKINAGFVIDPSFTVDDFVSLRQYIRDNHFDRVGIGVLTPFPGTELYNKRKNDLVVRDWSYYTGTYNVLPSKLPRDEFYKQYRRVQATATPLCQKMKNLMRLPFSHMFPSLWSYALWSWQRHRLLRGNDK